MQTESVCWANFLGPFRRILIHFFLGLGFPTAFSTFDICGLDIVYLGPLLGLIFWYLDFAVFVYL